MTVKHISENPYELGVREEEGSQSTLQVFHNVLTHILRPIYDVMEDGVSIFCGDGSRRLCFPRLAQYLADYEEQRVLACIVNQHCPKCTIPSFARSQRTPLTCDARDYLARTGDYAYEHRSRHADDIEALSMFGYHPAEPFTERYYHLSSSLDCSIYDALALDLLHQMSKNFFDFIYASWKKLMIDVEGWSEAKLYQELDARFSEVPLYYNLRWFRKGISKIRRWTGKEYKNMFKIFIGVTRGLSHKDLTRLAKAFLDVHRMASYPSHTDDEGRSTGTPGTLQLLDQAIDDFQFSLTNPNSVLVRHGIVKKDRYTVKLHYQLHYCEWIRQKGTLPQCSTDNSEAAHRAVKSAQAVSNKGPNAEDFMTKYEARQTGLHLFINDLNAVGVDTGDEIPAITIEEDTLVPAKLTAGVQLCGGKRKRFPMELLAAKNYLDLKGKSFASETLRTLAWIHDGRKPGSYWRGAELQLSGAREIIVMAVYNALRLVYPQQADPSKLVMEYCRCTEKYPYGKDRNWMKPQCDTVLVRYNKNPVNRHGGSTMDGRRVARLASLFKLNVLNNLQLALVQWFDCSRMPEQDTGMFIVTKKQEFEVIEVDTIERGVHLIPHFGRPGTTRKARQGDVLGLDNYEKFVINNHVDLDLYNMIF